MCSYILVSLSIKVSILIITFAMKFAAINTARLSNLPDYTRAGVYGIISLLVIKFDLDLCLRAGIAPEIMYRIISSRTFQ